MFSVEIRDRFVDLVMSGSSVDAAAAAVGASVESGQRWWRRSGGGLALKRGKGGGLAEPAAATDRIGAGRCLSYSDRRIIENGLREPGTSRAAIARRLGRPTSTVTREIARHRSADGAYRATVAHTRARDARRRPKTPKLARDPALCRRIQTWMDQGWSPALIARVLRLDGETGRVSHETIYRALYVQTRGSLRSDLHQQLSLGRAARVPRGTRTWKSSPYNDAFTISQRPAEAADRAVPGHWEGDLILGPHSRSAIGTLVERTTRFTILLHLPGRHDAATVADAMITQMRHLPDHLRRSITWDRGPELADYARIQLELDTRLFFCDPRSPWQRGTNENTNRLLRHWFTKGSDLSVHTANDLRAAQDSLNARPRPTLDLDTPAQRLNALLSQTAA